MFTRIFPLGFQWHSPPAFESFLGELMAAADLSTQLEENRTAAAVQTFVVVLLVAWIDEGVSDVELGLGYQFGLGKEYC